MLGLGRVQQPWNAGVFHPSFIRRRKFVPVLAVTVDKRGRRAVSVGHRYVVKMSTELFSRAFCCIATRRKRETPIIVWKKESANLVRIQAFGQVTNVCEIVIHTQISGIVSVPGKPPNGKGRRLIFNGSNRQRQLEIDLPQKSRVQKTSFGGLTVAGTGRVAM